MIDDNPDALDGFIVARKDGTLHCVAVDREDYGRVVAAGPWHVQTHRNTFCAARHIRRPDGRRTTEKLHRFILSLAPDDKRLVDHVNGDGLLNTRANLRVVTNKENQENIAPHRGSSSKYRGVSWHSQNKKWRAEVQQHHLGYFTSEVDAARAAAEGRAKFFTHHNEERHPVA